MEAASRAAIKYEDQRSGQVANASALPRSDCVARELNFTIFFLAFSAAEMAEATPSVFRGQAMRIATLLTPSVFVIVSKLTMETLRFESLRTQTRGFAVGNDLRLVEKVVLKLQHFWCSFINWQNLDIRFSHISSASQIEISNRQLHQICIRRVG
jgi:hypothetical protein